MGHQIVRQPNGFYAVWSTVVDNFILWDATPEEIITEEQVEMHERIAKGVRDRIAELERGEDHYGQRTFEQCIGTIKAIHGANDDMLKTFRKNGLI
jgi:hypothetical protein